MFLRTADAPQIKNQTTDDEQVYALRDSVPKPKRFARLITLAGSLAEVMDLVQGLHFWLDPQPANERHGEQSGYKSQVQRPCRTARVQPFSREMRQANGAATILHVEIAGDNGLRREAHTGRG